MREQSRDVFVRETRYGVFNLKFPVMWDVFFFTLKKCLDRNVFFMVVFEK